MLGPARRGNVEMHVARLQPEPEHRRQRADGIAALAVPHQFWFCRGARGEIEQHRIVGVGRAIRRKGLGRARRLLEREPAVVRRRRTDHDANQIVAAEACELRDLILRGHHHPRPAAIEPVAQFVRGEQRGRGDHDDAELHRRQHGLPQRHDIAEQQQQMIAALQPLRAQEVRHLIGTGRQRREGKFCFLVAGIDDPERGAVPAVGIAGQFRIEPVQRPVERNRIGPAKSLHGRIVIGAVLEQKGACFLEGRHQVSVISRRGSERAG